MGVGEEKGGQGKGETFCTFKTVQWKRTKIIEKRKMTDVILVHALLH